LHSNVHVPSLSCVNGHSRRRRRDAEVHRGALLDAGLAALVADPDAGLDAVAAAAGLSRRTVYGHFASRDALVAALADRAGEGVASSAPRQRTASTR
jgi:AcrR family transcriptional regulator